MNVRIQRSAHPQSFRLSPRRLEPAPVLRLPLLATAVWLACVPGMVAAQTSGLTYTGGLSSIYSSSAIGISGDGSIVVGNDAYDVFFYNSRAFRWTQADGMHGLGTLNGGDHSEVRGISGDGSVIVGMADGGTEGNGFRAFRWTQADGMQSLGTLNGGYYSEATGVSGDGSVIVGAADEDAPGYATVAFRWTQANGMQNLGTLNGGDYAYPYGVSGDGSVVVGVAVDGGMDGAFRAFRWTQADGMQALGGLNGDDFSYAYGASGDGSVIVGTATDEAAANAYRAFRWTEADGMQGLGTLNGSTFSVARGVSSDGSVIVGMVAYGPAEDIFRAFRWTQESGMQSVADWLRAAGVKVSPAAEADMEEAVGTSADGSVVVGNGPGGPFVARVVPSSGMITLAEASQSLESTASANDNLLRSTNLLMQGAHSRPLTRRVDAGQRAFWAAGDWGRDTHGSRDGTLGLVEAGAGWNSGAVQINAALGRTWTRETLALSGRAATDYTYVMAEALLPLTRQREYGLWLAVGGYGGWGEADIRRGYLNAGTPDASKAQPDTNIWGVRAHLEWDGAWRPGAARFSPYADLSYAQAKLDGYTESGGSFPARFDTRREDSTEARVGVNMRYALKGVQLVGLAEGVHRFEEEGAPTTGQMLGLFGFSFPGQAYRQDWLHAGAGIETRLAGGLFSVMLNATTRGEAASTWLAASWVATF